MTVGHKFPSFNLKACVSLEPGKEFADITELSHTGKWLVVFSWPMDFTFVCPTEIAEFGRRNADFVDRDAQVLGLSTDSHFVHLAWRRQHPDLRELPFPMLADNRRVWGLCDELGIIHPEAGVATRTTFIVDPQGIIRWSASYDLSVGRNVDEVLRVLDALQTDELCPCNWKSGEATLGA